MPDVGTGVAPQDFLDWQTQQREHPPSIEEQIALNNTAVPPDQRVMLDASGTAVFLTIPNQIKKALSGKIFGVPKLALAGLGIAALLYWLAKRRKKKTNPRRRRR